jgi:NAD(P)-dependent dehydrogenase (short-subunit alcohol dehydrogenase family)
MVVAAGRRRRPLDRLSQEAGDQVVGLEMDVADERAVRAAFAEVVARFGRIDLLFNNAGVLSTPAPVSEVRLCDWLEVIGVNLTGAFLCAREAFRYMSAQAPRGGRIINNGSISAHVPRPHAIAYTASKHAITGLTRSLSLEGRAFNIACSQIDVGNAATHMTEGFVTGTLQADGRLGREPVMDVGDVAASIVHMAGLPLEANVQFMTLMATAMPYIGRG